MRVLLLAPPGAGKGTQGVRIAEHYGIDHIATGDLLRDEVSRGTELGRRADDLMRRGELVPDELVVVMVLRRVRAAPDGWVLDGFPRNLAQAERAFEWGTTHEQTFDAVLFLDVPEDELVRRLLQRAAEQGRADDDEPTIRRRLTVYERDTAPLVAYYAGRGLVDHIDATGDVDDVTARVLAALEARAPRST